MVGMRKITLILGLLVIVISGLVVAVKNVNLSNSPDMPNGGKVELGFIRAVNLGGDDTLLFDDAIWLSGREAEDAAIDAGLCTNDTRSECLPNDFFILNVSKETETLEIDPRARFFTKTFDAEDTGILDKEINLARFAGLINDTQAYWNKLPYNVTVKNRRIIKVQEVYVP